MSSSSRVAPKPLIVDVTEHSPAQPAPLNLQAASRVYVVSAPLQTAAKVVRRALTQSNLAILTEADVSGSLRSFLRVELAPCRLLLVYCPLSLLQTLALYPSAAVFLPLHLVL